jgi:glycosyltransferase involved in cell wall biosynthesis
MSMKRIRIGYILPDARLDTDTHFYEKHEFIHSLARDADIRLISGGSNMVLVFCRVVLARVQGYKDFYVHYSFKGALAALWVTRVFGGRTYYWNCGMPWLYKRSAREERVFRYILSHAIFVTGTIGLSRMYQEQYGIRLEMVRIVPNAVRVARFQELQRSVAREKLGIAQDVFVILFVHHLSRRKGAEHIPQLLRQWRDDPSIFFVVVGSGPMEAEIQREIHELGLDHRVRFEGGVPNQDIPTYFALADVFLMPSEEEGVPHALLEAMASGLPFAASNVGGVREIVPPELYDFVLPHHDMYLFFKAIERLRHEEGLASKVAGIEKAFVARYDVAIVREQFLALFR